MKGGLPVDYRDAVPVTVAPYLLASIIGRRYAEKMPNGDFVCKMEDVHLGDFLPARSRPPGSLSDGLAT